MPAYKKEDEIEHEGRTLHVTACDPEFYEETVEDCTVRVAIGDDETDRDLKEMTGSDEHAVDAWLHGIYYPWALRYREEDDKDAAAEVQFEASQEEDRRAR